MSGNLHQHDFPRWYQERCDRMYWMHGQCCAGCDHWQSDQGLTGQCIAAGIVSGGDVMRSMDIEWSTLRFKPSHPFTKAEDWCGKFSDEFDWSSLDELYLHRIGAMVRGKMQPKPKQRLQKAQDTRG